MDIKHIFIVGAGRSGTKFIMNILNNSRFIHIAPEIHYFSSLTHNGFLKNLKRTIKESKQFTIEEVIYCLSHCNPFGTYWKRNFNFPKEEILEWFREKDLNEKSIYEFLIEQDYIKENINKPNLKYIGEKTPLNIFHVRKLFKWFPEAKILFIQRNPLEVLSSEVNKDYKPDYPLNKSNLFYPYGLVIYVMVIWFMAAIIAIYNLINHRNKFFIISYKYLNLQIEESVQQITEKIDIPYTKDLCNVKKVDSSYSKGEKSYWQPPKAIILLYKIFLSLIYRILDKLSLNSNH